MKKIRTYYDNLKVARNAPEAVIRAAYKALMQKYHPDKFEGSSEEALRIAKIIKASFDILIDPAKRAEHDKWIKSEEAKSEGDKATFDEVGQENEQHYYQQGVKKIKESNTPPTNNKEPQSYSIKTNPAKIWPRFFARSFDIAFENSIATYFSLYVLLNASATFNHWYLENGVSASLFISTLCVPMSLVIDAWIYNVFGNTAGKHLIGIMVKNKYGEALSFSQYLGRNFKLYVSGYFLGIPFAYFITIIYQAIRVNKGLPASYDESTGFSVNIKEHKIHTLRFSFSLVLMLISLQVFSYAFYAAIPKQSTILFSSKLSEKAYYLDKQKKYTDIIDLANQGDSLARFYLANMYDKGLGVSKDKQKAIWLYKSLYNELLEKAKTGDDVAQYYMAIMQEKAPPSAIEGDSSELNSLKQKRWQQFIYWLSESAKQNNAKAQHKLGSSYEHYEKIKNYEQALYWYTQAANNGLIDAQFALGYSYETGDIVPKSGEKAVFWYTKAANQGDLVSINSLANLYKIGVLVPQDGEKAIYWYTKASELKDADSQYWFGMMYFTGQSVPENYVLAHMWFNIAATYGNDLASNSRETVSELMSKEQLQQAQQLATEWFNAHQN